MLRAIGTHSSVSYATKVQRILEEYENIIKGGANTLALTLEEQKNVQQAENLCQDTLRGRAAVLGEKHPLTRASAIILESILDRDGRPEEAIRVHERALRDYKELGSGPLSDISNISSIGLELESRGMHQEAEQMYRKALEKCEKLLGAKHPRTLASTSHLGLCLWRQGKYKKAERFLRTALEGYEVVRGTDHLETLASLRNMGAVLQSQGKYEQAEEKYRCALEGYKQLLGPESSDVTATIAGLGSVFESQGKFAEAKRMYQQEHENYEKVSGKKDPATLMRLENLGSFLLKEGNYEEAETKLRQAKEGFEDVLGPQHPRTHSSKRRLSLAEEAQGKYDDAWKTYDYALEHDAAPTYNAQMWLQESEIGFDSRARNVDPPSLGEEKAMTCASELGQVL
ncbi:uncharacterized protein BJX67DRAFT_386084 [Aspergillus lucknowensis]|uniref:TPR-like protein n=1 Tax=Aspergillus lucknowensis TaxID=176173 RepID=A0ABR4L973_9EURO